MTEKIMYWASVTFGFVALFLFMGNAILITGNRQIQEEVNRRQGIISNTTNISNLNQNLAQALAEVAVKEKDTKVRDLLAAQGITVRDPAAVSSDGKPEAEASKTPASKKK